MKEKKEYRPIQIKLLYGVPIIAMVLIVACMTYIDLQNSAKKAAAMDSVPDSTIVDAINDHLPETSKISSLTQISAIFVDMDEREIKRVAQQDDYLGAQAIAKVYDWAIDRGVFVTDNDIRSRGIQRLYTHETEYYNLAKMANEIATAMEVVPGLS